MHGTVIVNTMEHELYEVTVQFITIKEITKIRETGQKLLESDSFRLHYRALF